MRIYIDFNTTTVYDVFALGFDGILERTLDHHRSLLSGHENPTVAMNVEYFRSEVYKSHLSTILYKIFGKFNSLLGSQLVCINTEQSKAIDNDPVAKLLEFGWLSTAVREIVELDERNEIEYLLFDERSQEKLYTELDDFRDELLRVIQSEIKDALKIAISWL